MSYQPTDAVAVVIDGSSVSQEEYTQALRARRDAVADELIKMRDRWVQHRKNSGVEERWRKASMLYFGFDPDKSSDLAEILREGPSRRTKARVLRSRVSINIVRPKVDQSVSRMCEIMLPIDGANFGLDASTIADGLDDMVGRDAPTIDPSTGQPTGFTADMEASAITQAAAESVAKHEKVIKDQQEECGYNAQLRLAMEDYVRLGTMIIEGPIPQFVEKVRWAPGSDGRYRKISERRVAPVSRRRDPWDVWFSPDCGNDHQRGAGYWVRELVTSKMVRELKEQPGFDPDALDAVLKETPKRAIADERVKRTAVTVDSSYELWVYHGEIDPKQYDCSCKFVNSIGGEDGDEAEEDDVDFGLVMIINDRVVGVMPSWVDDKKLPVSVACWRSTDDTPYGFGVPYEQEDQQSVVNAAWRQLMDHGRYTVGVQFIRQAKGVNPATNKDDITPTPNRMWDATGYDDVRKAFAAVDVPSHLNDYLNIVKAAMEYSDVESNMPALMSGSANNNAHETMGGMVMQFNNATTVLRHRVRTLDDNITSPQVSGYYGWNMAFHPDPSIKIEAKVVPKGSTSLLEKDIQEQMLIQALAILQNPRYSKYIDPEKELDLFLRAMRVRPEQIKLSVDEIKRRKQAPESAPPDPRIVSAEMALEAKKLDIADNKEQRAFEAGRNAAELQFRHENLVYNTKREDQEYEIAMIDSEIKRDAAIMKIQSNELISREGIIAKQRMQALEIDAGNQRMNAEMATKARFGSGI